MVVLTNYVTFWWLSPKDTVAELQAWFFLAQAQTWFDKGSFFDSRIFYYEIWYIDP